MSSTIYFFSSTGNCLSVARQIKNELENCEIHSIVHLMKERGIIPDSDIVGFVFPSYFGDMPPIVKKFIEKINFINAKYLFGINTAGVREGNTLHELERRLRKKGRKLDAGFFIPMPTNYLLGWYSNIIKGTKASRDSVIQKAIKQVDDIVPMIKNKTRTAIPRHIITAVIPKLINPRILFKKANTWDEYFMADLSCRSCGTCAKICPAKNIDLKNGRPVWKQECILCLSCIHWCPQQAIQFKHITKRRARYHHPDVKIFELYEPDPIKDKNTNND